jgi:hypothetical protein
MVSFSFRLYVLQIALGIMVSLTATARPFISFTPELESASSSVETFNSMGVSFMIIFIANNKTLREEPGRNCSHLSLRRHYPVQVVRV